MKTPANAKQVFMNKRFYLHFKSRANWSKASEVIRAFSGQIEECLDKTTTSYLLTDIPQEEWPPRGKDPILQRGINHAFKIMSYQNLINYCREYLIASSSSDDDDDLRMLTMNLRTPFIKFEDSRYKYQPTVKELAEWPEINLDEPLGPGQTIFGFNHANNANINSRTRQNSTHVMTAKTLPNSNVPQGPQPPKLRRNAIYCELCGTRVVDKLDEHMESQEHKSNIENARWGDLESVIDSLPSLDSLISSKRVQLTSAEEPQEFLCLHKVESLSQMFRNSSK
jgi:hypothetical protein